VRPGEAAAALLLSSRPAAAEDASRAPAVALRGFHVGRREPAADAAGRKAALAERQERLARSLAAAGLDADRVTALIGDAAQHSADAADLYALAQASLAHLDPLDDVCLPATLCGHTEAVAAVLALALAWERCRLHGEATLALALSEAPRWMVGVLGPSSTPVDQIPAPRND
jgi:hypothetical protein